MSGSFPKALDICESEHPTDESILKAILAIMPEGHTLEEIEILSVTVGFYYWNTVRIIVDEEGKLLSFGYTENDSDAVRYVNTLTERLGATLQNPRKKRQKKRSNAAFRDEPTDRMPAPPEMEGRRGVPEVELDQIAKEKA